MVDSKRSYQFNGPLINNLNIDQYEGHQVQKGVVEE